MANGESHGISITRFRLKPVERSIFTPFGIISRYLEVLRTALDKGATVKQFARSTPYLVLHVESLARTAYSVLGPDLGIKGCLAGTSVTEGLSK